MTGGGAESQRDSVLQPRVGEPASLPWVGRRVFPQPQRGCAAFHPLACRNPVGVGNCFASFTQGSSCLATLGWRPLPRWGKSDEPPGRYAEAPVPPRADLTPEKAYGDAAHFYSAKEASPFYRTD